MASELTEQLDKAKALVQDHRHSEAINTLRSVINHKGDLTSDVVLKAKEKAVIRLGKVFVQLKQPLELAALLRSLHPFFATIPKAKTAKLVRSLIDLLTEIPGTDNLITELCTEYIAWANEENRTVLRQRLEFKLAHSWYKTNQFKSALDLISKLNREVKRLDDKPMMVEVHLLESKIHHGLFNLSKARACLTAARTVANAIYCPPTLQADLDTVSGTLHSDEKDYKTAYSYFFEAFENYNHSVKERTVELHTSSDTGIPSPENLANQMSFKERTYLELSVKCLKYMLMCKIMSNVKEDVSALIGGKLALRYGTIELEAMRALAAAHAASSLKNFQRAMSKYETEIRADPFLNRHLNSLYDTDRKSVV